MNTPQAIDGGDAAAAYSLECRKLKEKLERMREAVENAVATWDENESRLREVSGDSVRFQFVKGAIDELRSAHTHLE